jgi:predicted O-methyltransferase YrrM
LNFFSLFKRKIIFKLKKKTFIDNENLSNKTLDELFYYYGSDKANIFKKNKRKGHGYSNFYKKILNSYKNQKISILEIGSFAGASAAAFSKYLPKAQIFCFDVNISNFKYSSKNIHVYGLDINKTSNVKKTIKKIFKKNHISNFDLIIDDGSHNLSDIVYSLNFFLKFLKNQGFFVIEDFKLPNYYDYNNNVDHIFIDELLENIKNKTLFNSSLLTKEDQHYLISSIKQIEVFKGNLSDSDICFIKKGN